MNKSLNEKNNKFAVIDIEEAIEVARRGDESYSDYIQGFIKEFNLIVLRGAGNFGTAFGAFLLEDGFNSESIIYWDNRAKELKEVNGIKVSEPFSAHLNTDSTLIINCIPNGSLSGSTGKTAFESVGYQHYLSGMALFEALMCGIKAETGFDAKVCLDTKFCNWCACKRLSSLMSKNERENEPSLVYSLATFVVSQKCTLSCSHCGQYINHYTKEEQFNIPIDRLKKI